MRNPEDAAVFIARGNRAARLHYPQCLLCGTMNTSSDSIQSLNSVAFTSFGPEHCPAIQSDRFRNDFAQLLASNCGLDGTRGHTASAARYSHTENMITRLCLHLMRWSSAVLGPIWCCNLSTMLSARDAASSAQFKLLQHLVVV